MSKIEDTLIKVLRSGKNAMFEGKAGTGKSTVIESVLAKLYGEDGYVTLYGGTMDPFLDLIGLPYAKGEKGSETLGYLRPHIWFENKRAVFIDEYNRAPKQVRNAVMELTQFGTVNGQKVDIETVVVAINPENLFDDMGRQLYNVEPVDPAQKDRFHFHFKMPNDLDIPYFTEKFGAEQAKCAKSFWSSWPENQRDRHGLTPRRMDYALEAYNAGFNIVGDVIDLALEPNLLVKELDSLNVATQFNALRAANDIAGLKKIINGTKSSSLVSLVETREEIETLMRYINQDRIPVLLDQEKFNLSYDGEIKERCLIATSKIKENGKGWDWRQKAAQKFWPVVHDLGMGLSSRYYVNNLNPDSTEQDDYYSTTYWIQLVQSGFNVDSDDILVKMSKFICKVDDKYPHWFPEDVTEEDKKHPDFKIFLALLGYVKIILLTNTSDKIKGLVGDLYDHRVFRLLNV